MITEGFHFDSGAYFEAFQAQQTEPQVEQGTGDSESVASVPQSQDDIEGDIDFEGACAEAELNGKAIHWGYWLDLLIWSAQDAARLMAGLDPDIFPSLEEGREESAKARRQAKRIERMALSHNIREDTADGWLKWARGKFRLHPPFPLEVTRHMERQERYRELARKPHLTASDWIALTGAGCADGGRFLITPDGVYFIKWEERFIKGQSLEEQIESLRDNEQPPLLFPCTPAELLRFIDNVRHDLYEFAVPDAFRQAVQAAASSEAVEGERRRPQLLADAIEQNGDAARQTLGPTSPGNTTKTRTNAIQAILEAFFKEGVGRNIESVWEHIRQHAGKNDFPFSGVSQSTATDWYGKQHKKENMRLTLQRLLKRLEKNKVAIP